MTGTTKSSIYEGIAIPRSPPPLHPWSSVNWTQHGRTTA